MTTESPQPYLSSRRAGWEYLTAEAFLEPAQLHGWKRPPTPEIRLILLAGGPLRFDSGGADNPTAAPVVREGHFILRPGVEPYEVGWKSLSSMPTQSLVLHLDRSLLTRTAQELGGRDPAQVELQNRVGFEDPLLKEICLALWRELLTPSYLGKLYVQSAAQMLAVHLLLRYAVAPVTVKEPSQVLTPRQLRSVTDLVLADVGRNLSLKTLAAQAGLSPYHFARLFRKTTGTSPHQFVLTQRLEKARCLLQRQDVTLADVALDAGFANQSHLTRTFKRRFGVTPRTYRQKA